MGEDNFKTKRNRHKWKKDVNHPFCHKFTCIKCGCTKDATSVNVTIYELNGERQHLAPSCPVYTLKKVVKDYLGYKK